MEQRTTVTIKVLDALDVTLGTSVQPNTYFAKRLEEHLHMSALTGKPLRGIQT